MVISLYVKTFSYFQKKYSYFSKTSRELFRQNSGIFISYNIKLRSKYWFELDAIANMDETPLHLNMPPSTTVQKIGSKRVNIKTQGQENWRVTAILTILASGEKLPPLLIFKAKEGKQTDKKLQGLEIVENKKVFDYWQENAWNSESIMLRWIEDIWKKYSFF